jgi:PAS domain S-box-containing protein
MSNQDKTKDELIYEIQQLQIENDLLKASFNECIVGQNLANEKLLLFNYAIESAHNAIGISNANGLHYYQNKAFSDLFGYATSDELQANGGVIMLFNNPEIGKEIYNNMLSGKAWNGELEMKKKDDRVFSAFFNLDIIKDNANNTIGFVSIINDISSYKKALEKINETEEKFKNAFEAANVGKSITLPTGEINVNQAFCDMLGYNQEELKQKKWQEITPADDIDFTQMKIEPLLKGEIKSTRFNKRYIHKNGKQVWADVNVALQLDAKKKPLYFITTVMDITERKLMEDSLKSSKDYAENLIQTANAIVIGMDTTGKIKTFNKAAELITGYTLDDLKDKNWFETVVPRERYPEVWEIFEKLKAGGLPKYFENPILTKSGEEKYIIWHNNEIIEHGKITGSISFGIDITDRMKTEKALQISELKYRRLHESMMDGFIHTTMQGKIIDCNGALLQMIGYTMDEISKLTYKDITPEKWHQYENDIVENEILQNGYSQIYLKEYIRKDGTVFPIEIRSFLIKNDKDENEGIWAIIRDISQRKLFENKIMESEANARAIMESTDDVMILLSKDGIVIDCNEAHARRFNTTRNELIGTNAFKLLPKEIADKRRQYVNQVFLTGKSIYSEDFRAGYWNEFSIHPIFINNAITDKVAIFSKDITKRKLAEEALLQSKRELSTLMDNLQGMVYTCLNDKDWTMKFTSEGSLELTGYTANELTSNFITYNEIIHSDDRNMVWDNIQQAIMQKTAYTIEYRIITKSKSIKNVWERGQGVFDENGKLLHLEGFITDITEKKQNEELLRDNYSLLRLAGKTARFGGWSVDLKKNEVIWSDQTAIIHEMNAGYNPTVNEGISFYAPEWQERIFEVYTNCVEKGIPYDEEMEIITGKGKRIWIRTTGEAVFDTNGSIIKVQGSFQDVNDYKVIMETIKLNEAHLKEMNAEKDKFFSIIAHDLKSPFNSIVGFSELIVDQSKEKDFEGMERYAEVILQSSKRAMDLLTNLMEWSRSQTGRIEFNPEYIEMVDFINETTLIFDDIARQKNIVINKELPSNAIAFADKSMMSTVMRNLVSNAIKFTKSNGRIIISIEEKPKEIILAVKDNGIGIAKSDIEKLFKIEESYSTKGTQNEQGTGLGLILCKEFVEKHNGKIWAESEQGFGSTFYLSIPTK